MKTAFFAALLFVGCVKAPEPQRIVVVDMQRAVADSKQGLAARERLKKRFDESQARLDVRQAELKAEMNDVSKREAVTAQLLELQKQFETAQQELKDLESAEIAPLMKQLGEQISVLTAERKIDVVLDVQSVPWVKPEFDITAELVRRLDENVQK